MHFIYTFFAMFAFWILLSGKFDLFHLALGVISSVFVAFISKDLFFHRIAEKNKPVEICRFIRYIPWLIYEIFLATLHVAYLALHPRMMDLIDPKIINFKTTLKRDIAQVVFATSITLTPGTITIRIVDGEYYIHALSEKSAKGVPGDMEEQLSKVFKEDT